MGTCWCTLDLFARVRCCKAEWPCNNFAAIDRMLCMNITTCHSWQTLRRQQGQVAWNPLLQWAPSSDFRDSLLHWKPKKNVTVSMKEDESARLTLSPLGCVCSVCTNVSPATGSTIFRKTRSTFSCTALRRRGLTETYACCLSQCDPHTHPWQHKDMRGTWRGKRANRTRWVPTPSQFIRHRRTSITFSTPPPSLLFPPSHLTRLPLSVIWRGATQLCPSLAPPSYWEGSGSGSDWPSSFRASPFLGHCLSHVRSSLIMLRVVDHACSWTTRIRSPDALVVMLHSPFRVSFDNSLQTNSCKSIRGHPEK